MSERENIQIILSKSKMFSDIETESLRGLSEKAHILNKQKNETIFCQDETASLCYYLIEGHIKLSRNTSDGDENVIDIVSSGALIGDSSFFNDGLYSYNADTVSPVKLVGLPLVPLSSLVKKDPQFCCQMLRHIAGQALEKDKELERRTLQETSHRVGCFILSLCEDHASGSIDVELPYEKALVAKRLGMRPETLSRSLQRLHDDTGVSIKGTLISVPDIKKLSEYSCASCSYSLTCNKTGIAVG